MRGAAIENKPESADPLLSAIAELRDQIDRLIDEQQAALEGFASELDGDRSAVVDRSALAVEAEASAILPNSPAAVPSEAESGARSDDPRERLDALAKHFDRRLRASGSPPTGLGPPS